MVPPDSGISWPGSVAAWLLSLFVVAAGTAAEPSAAYFAVKVVDEATGRGVPLVELRTVNQILYVTDSSGLAAINEPGLLGQTVFFHVKSHGYEFPKDGFGFRGVRLKVEAGGEATVKLRRRNIAERLYRVTGAGIYRDTVLLGRQPPLQQPLLNGRVFGSDSVVNAVYHGKIYWFWGDTNRPSYPLGNFHVPGATSELPGQGGLEPEVGVDLEYFVDDQGFAKETAKLPGPGPTWINGLVALNDDGRQRLFATYAKIEPPLKVYERGLVEFNDRSRQFELRTKFDLDAPALPHGHPFLHKDGDVSYIYFADPLPNIRVKADVDHLHDPATYETFSCFRAGSRADAIELDRDDAGRLRYTWKTDTVPMSPKLQSELIAAKRIRREEARFHIVDADTEKPVVPHRGTVAWNAYRNRWIMIFTETFGTSVLGEVWLAESDELTGPWHRAKKIVTHDKYSFYNPKHHTMFDKDDGRIIFFEGTYTTTFSGNSNPTPRYDYNQVMYQLDLSDPRLQFSRK